MKLRKLIDFSVWLQKNDLLKSDIVIEGLEEPTTEESKPVSNPDELESREVESLRELSMRLWSNLNQNNKIDLMGYNEDYVGRKPSSLTGREIEILFFGDRTSKPQPKGMSAKEALSKIYKLDSILSKYIPS